MANMTTETLTRASGLPHDMKSKFEDESASFDKISRNAGKQIGAAISNFASSATEYVKSGTEYVQENPAKGVVIAAAAGVVVGSLITLAMRRRH